MITLAISLVVLLLDIEATDTRIATAVGGLMAEIFLQLYFSGNLPQSIDYLSLVDWVFNISYLAILFVIVECVIVRKIFYQLLSESQKVKDEIELATLQAEVLSKDDFGSVASIGDVSSPPKISPRTSTPGTDLLQNANKSNRKKEKIKTKIVKIERILFLSFVGVCLTLIGVITLGIKFGNK